MDNSEYTYPILSVNDVIDTYHKYDTSAEAKEVIAYFVSELCGISVDRIEMWNNENNK